jgi:hypothetical protein
MRLTGICNKLAARDVVRRLAVLLLALLVLPANAEGDRASAESVKAGFVYNFTKFSTWPAPGGGADPLRICTLGRGALNGQLARLQGRTVGEREIEIQVWPPSDDWAKCHVLFVSREDGERAESILRQLAGKPVLTIGDVPDFSRRGGMIELIELENKLRFNISLVTVQRSGLRMSSQLLKLATRVWQ